MDLSRREFMLVGTSSLLAIDGTGSLQIDQNNETIDEYEFSGVADLMGPRAARPDPPDPFFDNKIAFAYRYETTDTDERFFIEDGDSNWTSLMSNKDYLGKQSVNSIFSQQQAESRYVDLQQNFRYNIPDDAFLVLSSDGTDGVSGSGNVGVRNNGGRENGIGFAETGTGTSGSAIVQDRNRAWYRAGQEVGAIFTARFDTNPDATLRIGLHDLEDGFFLEHNGAEYRFVNRNGSTDDATSRSNWEDPLDGTGSSGVTVDFSTLSIWRITFGHLGTAPAFLEYYAGESDGWVLAHVIDYPNDFTGTNVRNPTLPMQMEATRPSGSGNASVGSGSWMGYVLTNDDTDPGLRLFDYEGRRSSPSSSTNEHIVTVQNKGTYQGLDNNIQIKPSGLSTVAAADDTTTFYIVRGATTNASLSFSDRNTENSVAEVATDATSVTDSDRIIARIKIPEGGNKNKSTGAVVSELESQRIAPGERISVYATTPGKPSLFEATLKWQELF